MSKAFSAIKLTIWHGDGDPSCFWLLKYSNMKTLMNSHPLPAVGVILHVLTGVKRVASDNTAVSGTPSLDNYITPRLHCLHSLQIILLNSQWLESQRQRDKWQGVGRQWSPTLSTAQLSGQSFCQVTMELKQKNHRTSLHNSCNHLYLIYLIIIVIFCCYFFTPQNWRFRYSAAPSWSLITPVK